MPVSEIPISSTSPDGVQALRFRRAFLLVLLTGISILFLAMIRDFLLTVFLAAVFAGLTYSLYSWFLRKTGGLGGLASVITILLLVVGIALPLGGFLTLVVAEAGRMGGAAQEWFAANGYLVERGRNLAARIPFAERVLPTTSEIASSIEEATGRMGSILWGAAAAATRGTAGFLLQTFIFLYALFFFFLRGPEARDRLLGYVPLSPQEKAKLLERFTSVAGATLRGSLLIGIIQGGVAGVAFWAAGVPGAAFWGVVMVVFSILPAIGSGIVWVPAVAYLFIAGETVPAIHLLIWCAVVVGSIDNYLRPLLIGISARMSDLMILLCTLGGIALFGAVGFVVGPIIAALFVSVWQIYGEAFADWLPDVASADLAVEVAGDAVAGGGGGEDGGGE
jgi:predicted PurR-regulated permease PerM